MVSLSSWLSLVSSVTSYLNRVNWVNVVMVNSRERKRILNPPTHEHRTRSRLLGFCNGLTFLGSLDARRERESRLIERWARKRERERERERTKGNEVLVNQEIYWSSARRIVARLFSQQAMLDLHDISKDPFSNRSKKRKEKEGVTHLAHLLSKSDTYRNSMISSVNVGRRWTKTTSERSFPVSCRLPCAPFAFLEERSINEVDRPGRTLRFARLDRQFLFCLTGNMASLAIAVSASPSRVQRIFFADEWLTCWSPGSRPRSSIESVWTRDRRGRGSERCQWGSDSPGPRLKTTIISATRKVSSDGVPSPSGRKWRNLLTFLAKDTTV